MPVNHFPNSRPITWKPKGISDAVDGTNSFPGAMSSLANLIPDPTTQNIFVPRPAAQQLATLQGAASENQISSFLILGNIVYGMASSVEFAGLDAPFAYDLVENEFIPISGITGTNLPTSQPLFGDWIPPNMATVSHYILICHPGFNTGNGFFGWLDIAIPGSPKWSSGNTSGTPLVGVPRCVSIFSGRAYYAVGNATTFSDALIPLQVTNITQTLVYGDSTPITAMAGLPLNNLLGGVVQSLFVFKAATAIFQVTGDQTTDNLAINELPVQTGTMAPNTLVTTPLGLTFVAPDGLRVVDLNGNVSNPIGVNGQGVSLPFIQCVYKSRMGAAFNQNVLRITLPPGSPIGGGNAEYWFDFNQKLWTGPHSIPSGLLAPWQNTFIVSINNLAPSGSAVWDLAVWDVDLWDGGTSMPTMGLFRSDVFISPLATYFELGADLSWIYATVLLPDNEQMAENAMIETNLAMSFLTDEPTVTITVADVNGDLLDTVPIASPGTTTLWNEFDWNQANWNGTGSNISPWTVAWDVPIVFKQMVFSAAGESVSGFRVGNLYMRYQILGYRQQLTSGVT